MFIACREEQEMLRERAMLYQRYVYNITSVTAVKAGFLTKFYIWLVSGMDSLSWSVLVLK